MLTVADIEHHLTETYPLPYRTFGLPDSEYGSSEWKIRRMVANIIVGGSRDVQAVKATIGLFDAYSLQQLANPKTHTKIQKPIADMLEHEYDIKYTGKKAENILQSIQMVMEQYGGELPEDYNELIKLPGVGHHAATIILALTFGQQEQFGVDLHVRRITKRMKLVPLNASDKKIEAFFLENADHPAHLSRAFVEFGQSVCRYHPSCKKCPFQSKCPKIEWE